MSDLEFVEKLVREWVDIAFEEYRSASNSPRKSDRFRLGELRGRFDALESFAGYLKVLQRFSRAELEMMKRQ